MATRWVRATILAAAAATVLPVPSLPGQEKKSKTDPALPKFEALLAAARKEPRTADWKALRRAYAETAGYNPYDMSWRESFAKAIKQVKEGDPKASEAVVLRLLERDRSMRIDAHFLAAELYEKLKRPEKVALHRGFIEGISSTLFVPGKGLSFEKPIEVLFLEEEYLFLATLRVKAKRQGLSRKDGRSCDVYKVEASGDQPERTFYFNVDLPQKSLHRKLEKMQEGTRKDKA